MGLRFFRVAANGNGDEERELNAFLDTHRVISVERQLIDVGMNSYWAICAEYISGEPATKSASKKPRVDYKEILTPEQFSRFVKLREVRQELARKEAVPVYTIFTNEQLAAMITQEVNSVGKLGEIPGIGKARVDKYGEAFLGALTDEADEAS